MSPTWNDPHQTVVRLSVNARDTIRAQYPGWHIAAFAALP
jgi:hypothetical protein